MGGIPRQGRALFKRTSTQKPVKAQVPDRIKLTRSRLPGVPVLKAKAAIVQKRSGIGTGHGRVRSGTDGMDREIAFPAQPGRVEPGHPFELSGPAFPRAALCFGVTATLSHGQGFQIKVIYQHFLGASKAGQAQEKKR